MARVKAEYRDKQKRDMLVGMILEDKVLTLMENAASISKPGDAPPAEAKADAQDGGDEGDEKTKKAAAKKTPKKTAGKKKAAKEDDD